MIDNIKMDITEVGFVRGTKFSLYSKYLQGWSVRGSNPSRSKRLHSHFKMSRPALGPTQPPVQMVEVYFPGGKAAVA